MSKLRDLTRQRFGSLIVIERADRPGKKGTFWLCQCDCGNTIIKESQGLINGKTTCCDRYKCPNRKQLGKDITGQKFGRLTAIKPLSERKNNSIVWECKCDCGNIINVDQKSLSTHSTKSCGCLKKESDHAPKGNVIDLLGQKFGHLTVIARDGSDKFGEAKWLCECDCEAHSIISVLSSNLRSGHTCSCGCERRSKGERTVAKILSDNSIPYITEYKPFKFASGGYAAFDFYVNNQYLIEYDGETHYQYNLHGWHNLEQLEKQQERDIIKNQWCKDNNIPLIRIPYWHLENLCIEDLLPETSKYIME